MIINSKSGFTLIELLLTVTITSMIMIGLHQAMSTSLSAYGQNRHKQDLLARTRYALERMSKFVQVTDSITEPDTIEDHEILQVSERLLDTYDNADRTYIADGDSLIDADNDADNVVDEGCADTADIVTFSLDKTDGDNWKLIEQIPDYSTPDPDDFAATRVISENVTAFTCSLVTASLIEIALTLADGSETITLKTRVPATHVTSYVGPASDSSSPTPDPTTWASLPAATCNQVAMTASVTTDNKTPVQYYFECTAGAGHDSGWQTSTLYTDTGLAYETGYTYRVRTRDQSAGKNETGWSSGELATTTAAEPITVDSDNITMAGGDATSKSWDHTVTSDGSNRILIVGAAYKGDADKGVQSVTYGGQNLSRAGIVNNGDKAGSEIWYLTNPPTGTNTVLVTMKAAVDKKCGAITFLNVHQTVPFGTYYSETGSSSSPSVNVSGVNEFEVVVDHLAVEKDPSATAGSDQARQWHGRWSDDIRTACSTEDGPEDVGTVTMSWSLSEVKKWALVAVALKPGGCQ